MLTALARATGICDANGHRTRYYPHVTAPAKQVRAVPLAPAGTAAAEQPRSSPQPRRRPRRPRQRPRQQSCHGLCSSPRRSRAFHAAHAPRQRLTQACAPGHPDIFDRRDSVVSSIRLRKPGRSTLPVLLPPPSSIPAPAPSAFRRMEWPEATSLCPPSGLPSHSLSDGWSRHSAQHDGGSPSGDGGTPPRRLLLHARSSLLRHLSSEEIR